jgi:hypothetical protein
LEDGSIGNIDPKFDDVFKNLTQACVSFLEIENDVAVVEQYSRSSDDSDSDYVSFFNCFTLSLDITGHAY